MPTAAGCRAANAERRDRIEAAVDAAFRRREEIGHIAALYEAVARSSQAGDLTAYTTLPEEIQHALDTAERNYKIATEAMCEFEARIKREGARVPCRTSLPRSAR